MEISAKEKALRLLTRSSLSAGMLESKLCQYYDQETSAKTVEQMKAWNLINDLEYGNRLARDLQNFRYYSLNHIKQELYKRKIDKAYINEIIKQFSEQSEIDTLSKLIAKKYKNRLANQNDREKLIISLQRKGFYFDDINKALLQLDAQSII